MGLIHDQMVVKPPVLLLGSLVGGPLLGRVFPVPLAPSNDTAHALGMSFVIVAFGLFLWSVSTFRGFGERVMPEAETETLVQSGPYRYSRNPIYVAMAMLIVGAGLWTHNAWHLVLLCLCISVMHVGVVLREEAYLLEKLGPEYRDYCERVNRYL